MPHGDVVRAIASRPPTPDLHVVPDAHPVRDNPDTRRRLSIKLRHSPAHHQLDDAGRYRPTRLNGGRRLSVAIGFHRDVSLSTSSDRSLYRAPSHHRVI